MALCHKATSTVNKRTEYKGNNAMWMREQQEMNGKFDIAPANARGINRVYTLRDFSLPLRRG